MKESVVLSCVRKSARERVVIRLLSQAGRTSIDLRVFDLTGSVEFPSKHGFALSPELLPMLEAAIKEASARLTPNLLAEEFGANEKETTPCSRA